MAETLIDIGFIWVFRVLRWPRLCLWKSRGLMAETLIDVGFIWVFPCFALASVVPPRVGGLMAEALICTVSSLREIDI